MNIETAIQSANETNTTSTRARWMVVDDNASLREMVSRLLEVIADAEVCRFGSGEEALSAFITAPESFQFVMTDFDMPGMNGIDLCRSLRVLAPSLKVVLATGSEIFSDEGIEREGFCGLLHKPYPLAALRGVLESNGLLQPEQQPKSAAVEPQSENVVVTTA